MPASFEIRLLRAGSLSDQPHKDPMLGGAMRVTINGVVIADDDDFGLERSALGLLRTIEEDHDATGPRVQHRIPGREDDEPMVRAGFPTLLIHDCGFPVGGCSNFYVDWTVRHADDSVHITDVQRFDSLRPTDLTFPTAACTVPLADYRAEVLRFAQAVRDAYFADGDRLLDDPEDRRMYDAFWAEYNFLLTSHGPDARLTPPRP
jgi:hypothetical protein